MMKIEKITYGKSFENIAGLWERMTIEAELEPEETPEQGFDQAKQIIDGWHKENNPHLYAIAMLPPSETADRKMATQESALYHEEFEQLKRELTVYEYREDAQKHLDTTTFRLSIEAKKIVNSKPSKP